MLALHTGDTVPASRAGDLWAWSTPAPRGELSVQVYLRALPGYVQMAAPAARRSPLSWLGPMHISAWQSDSWFPTAGGPGPIDHPWSCQDSGSQARPGGMLVWAGMQVPGAGEGVCVSEPVGQLGSQPPGG